jgi:RNA polymerase sigma factor (sigma-70 family)
LSLGIRNGDVETALAGSDPPGVDVPDASITNRGPENGNLQERDVAGRPAALTFDPPSPFDPIDESVERAALHGALARLTPDHRAVVALHYLEGLTVDQIADRLGVRAGTVKSRIHYGVSELRAAYEAAQRDPGRTDR